MIALSNRNAMMMCCELRMNDIRVQRDKRLQKIESHTHTHSRILLLLCESADVNIKEPLSTAEHKGQLSLPGWRKEISSVLPLSRSVRRCQMKKWRALAINQTEWLAKFLNQRLTRRAYYHCRRTKLDEISPLGLNTWNSKSAKLIVIVFKFWHQLPVWSWKKSDILNTEWIFIFDKFLVLMSFAEQSEFQTLRQLNSANYEACFKR